MKKLRRLWALLLLGVALCLALTGCGSAQKEGSVEERLAAYRERFKVAREQLDKYAEAYKDQDPEKVSTFYFDWHGDLIFFIEPNYEGLEDELREKIENPNLKVAYTNYTDEYLYMVESLVKDYMAAHPGEEDPMGISSCKMDWSSFRRVRISAWPEGWSEEKDRLLKETFGQHYDAIFVEGWGKPEFETVKIAVC